MKCYICEKGCSINDGSRGACGRYTVTDGNLAEIYPDRYLVMCPISAETMPVLNFYPKSKFLQISTAGCNFDCEGCVATVVAKEVSPDSGALKHLTPPQVVKRAIDEKCSGIAFLMNDPLASYFTFLETAKLAKEKGLLVGCSTNGYFTEKSLDCLAPYLDFVNIGIKGLTDADYVACGALSYEPVIRNIRRFHEKGVHVEAACMHKNGGDENVIKIAETIRNISKEIPLQIMRFIPLGDADITEEPTVARSEAVRNEAAKILDYVYLFNSPGTDGINTYCPSCGQLIFERDFYGPMGAKLRQSHIGADNTCPSCGHKIKIAGKIAAGAFDEEDFEGGYPFTRALEIIEGTLAAIGVRDRKDIIRCWEDTLGKSGMPAFHGSIQNFAKYSAKIKYFGNLTGRKKEAGELVTYMAERIYFIKHIAAGLKEKPTVYYVMSGPLFALEDGRLENDLAETAGGISINKTLLCHGRPGMKISPEKLNELNPDVIFISSFMQSPPDDFYARCEKLGINVNAVRNKRIYNHIAPCFDFGSPRWILGLMHIAICLHPDVFTFDMIKEAEKFYSRFYGVDFDPAMVNRSFARPRKDFESVI